MPFKVFILWVKNLYVLIQTWRDKGRGSQRQVSRPTHLEGIPSGTRNLSQQINKKIESYVERYYFEAFFDK
jgi:hypothetical protein